MHTNYSWNGDELSDDNILWSRLIATAVKTAKTRVYTFTA